MRISLTEGSLKERQAKEQPKTWPETSSQKQLLRIALKIDKDTETVQPLRNSKYAAVLEASVGSAVSYKHMTVPKMDK